MDSVGRGCYLGVREERLRMDTYVCKKCGEELYLDDIENWDERKCPECDEPIPWNLAEDELRDLTRR